MNGHAKPDVLVALALVGILFAIGVPLLMPPEGREVSTIGRVFGGVLAMAGVALLGLIVRMRFFPPE